MLFSVVPGLAPPETATRVVPRICEYGRGSPMDASGWKSVRSCTTAVCDVRVPDAVILMFLTPGDRNGTLCSLSVVVSPTRT